MDYVRFLHEGRSKRFAQKVNWLQPGSYGVDRGSTSSLPIPVSRLPATKGREDQVVMGLDRGAYLSGSWQNRSHYGVVIHS